MLQNSWQHLYFSWKSKQIPGLNKFLYGASAFPQSQLLWDSKSRYANLYLNEVIKNLLPGNRVHMFDVCFKEVHMWIYF